MASDVGEVLRGIVTRLGAPADTLERVETVVRELVRAETSRAIRAMGLATTAELERLAAQVADLKRALAESAPAPKASGSKAAGPKASGSKASGSKASASKASSGEPSSGSRPRKRPAAPGGAA